MRCQWQVEFNPWRQAKLFKHWPNVRKYGNIRDFEYWRAYGYPTQTMLAPVDLICGGFPCQPHSVAGRRKGAADDRHLWPAMLEIIAAVRPIWVLGENVPGIVSTFLDDVISDLEGLGYTCRPFIVPACAVDAPHRRDRVWIVAHAECGERRQGEPCGNDAYGNTPQRQEAPGWPGASGAHGGAPALADSERVRELQPQGGQPEQRGWSGDCCQTVAHTEGQRQRSGLCADEPRGLGGRRPGNGGCAGSGAFSGGERLAQRKRLRPEGTRPLATTSAPCRWPAEPDVGRVAYGIPARVDRVSALGDAVVPVLVEEIGRMIVAAHYGWAG